MLLEVPAFSLESAQICASFNVDRIEFCQDYSVGGLTPRIADFVQLRKYFQGPIHVMVRPIASSFVCNDSILKIMLNEIDAFNNAGADGFVFGCLNHKNEIDQIGLEQLVKQSGNKNKTFHRAIDQVNNYNESIKTLVELGVTHVLTSGHAKSAKEGIKNLEELISTFGHKIEIIAGGGIRSNNVDDLIKNKIIKQIHSAAITDFNNFVTDKIELELLHKKLHS